jgi:hypothetical protein
MLAVDRWHILGNQWWHNSGAHCQYIVGENTWHNLGDQTRYIITRLMTRIAPGFTILPSEAIQPIQVSLPIPVRPLRPPASKKLRDSDEVKTITEPLQEQANRFEHRPTVGITFVNNMIEHVVKKNHAARFDLLR